MTTTNTLQGLNAARAIAPVDPMQRAFEELKLRNRYSRVKSLCTGIAPVDEHLTEELMPGRLLVLAGGTGSGKTMLASQLALALASQADVMHVSLEDRPEDVEKRWLAHVSGLDFTSVQRGCSDTHAGRGLPAALYEARKCIEELNIRVPDLAGMGLDDVARTVRSWRLSPASMPWGVVVVDQLSEIPDADPQQWPPDWGRTTPRPPKVRALDCDKLEWKVNFLRAVAEQCGCLVVLVAQLNNERDAKGRPTTDSLRGSKGIGHKADSVWLLHEPSAQPSDGGATKVELIAEKARHGKTFVAELIRDGARQRFRDLSEDRSGKWKPVPGPDADTLEGERRLAELLEKRRT